MKFSEIVNQAVVLLQESGRITYRALKLEFDLNDEQLDVLKDELIVARELAADKDGKMLVWTGGETTEDTTSQILNKLARRTRRSHFTGSGIGRTRDSSSPA